MLLAVLAFQGCTSAYWKDRARDAGQILELGVTWGPGMEGSLRATEVAQVGIGATDGWQFGWLEGRPVGVREERGEFGISLLHVYHYRRDGKGQLLDVRHPRWADPGYRDYPLSWMQISDRRWLDVGGSLHLVYVGGNAVFRLDELADFFTGIFGYDLLRDDVDGPSLEELRRQAHSLDARLRARAFDALLRRGEDVHGYDVYTVPDVRPGFQREAIEALDAAHQPPPPEPPEPGKTPDEEVVAPEPGEGDGGGDVGG